MPARKKRANRTKVVSSHRSTKQRSSLKINRKQSSRAIALLILIVFLGALYYLVNQRSSASVSGYTLLLPGQTKTMNFDYARGRSTQTIECLAPSGTSSTASLEFSGIDSGKSIGSIRNHSGRFGIVNLLSSPSQNIFPNKRVYIDKYRKVTNPIKFNGNYANGSGQCKISFLDIEQLTITNTGKIPIKVYPGLASIR